MNNYDKKINSILVSLKKPKTQEEIAKKHSKKLDIPLEKTKKILKKQLQKGQKIEKEHTTSKKAAKTIAKHHEDEELKYYDILKKTKL